VRISETFIGGDYTLTSLVVISSLLLYHASMLTDRFPILEFDPASEAILEPAHIVQPRDVPEHCVICFFQEVLTKVCAEHQAATLLTNRWEDGPHSLYEMAVEGRRLAFFHPGVGAPMAAGLLEEVIAAGCRKFIACGGAGVLTQEIAVGHLVVPTVAVRDEGISYHYCPPAREIDASAEGVAAIERTLTRHAVPYQLGKTWTTDAPYRETQAKVARRRAEGCLTVDMEAAAFFAVAQFRRVPLAQILYGGDDVSGGGEWDDRGWQSRTAVREKLFWLAVEACLTL
jgi:uridine phosphorylase